MVNNCKKGYFQFEVRPDGLYLTVYPPKDKEQAVDVEKAVYYLNKKKIFNYDAVEMNEAFKKGATKPTTVKISDDKYFANQEFGDYTMSSDCMLVEAEFYPPFIGAQELSIEEIVSDLEHIGVKNGIKLDVVEQFIKNKNYFEPMIIAEGTTVRQGRDGFVEYKFNTQLKPVPKVNEDGTVDFHTLENVNHVRKGDVLAVLHPEDRGEPGADLFGRVVLPKKVRHAKLRTGKNMRISGDGLRLLAETDGHVILEGDKIFMSNVLELIDVDMSTGDINYNGDVYIKGNVLAGFTVKASGDISINGIVEGATIEAGGNITFNRGVQGMTRAIIKAGGDVVTKFIESAKNVEIGGKLEAGSILHSKVNVKGPIIATGKKGLIVGGEVRSIVLIQAKTLGNEMGTTTVLGVGVDPSTKKRIDEIKENLQELTESKAKFNQVLDVLRKRHMSEGELPPDKKELQQSTMRKVIMIEKELTEQRNELEQLKAQLREDGNARIKVSGNTYLGCRLVFGEQIYFVKDRIGHCQFIKEKGEIKSYLL